MERMSQRVIDRAQALVDAGDFKGADAFFQPYTRWPSFKWQDAICEMENQIVDGLIEMNGSEDIDITTDASAGLVGLLNKL